jgi:hypothetical protein
MLISQLRNDLALSTGGQYTNSSLAGKSGKSKTIKALTPLKTI